MLIAGNWKMYKGPDETREFCARCVPGCTASRAPT